MLLHFCHRVPVPVALRGLLRSAISICATTVWLLLRHGRMCPLRIRELAILLLLLLPTRDLIAGILLLVLEQELTRELLV